MRLDEMGWKVWEIAGEQKGPESSLPWEKQVVGMRRESRAWGSLWSWAWFGALPLLTSG